MVDISRYIKGYELISPAALKNKTEGVFCAFADKSEMHKEYGINEGDLLFFDSTESFVDGKVSCFAEEKNDALKISKHQSNGYIYLGKLVSVMAQYNG